MVIKGANTITVFNNRLQINTTGNPGLATAGSGDVLTGVITGLISQGYEPLAATVFGIYLHGKSADIAIETYGYQSLIASNVIDHIKDAYMDLFKEREQSIVSDQEDNENEEKDDEENLYV